MKYYINKYPSEFHIIGKKCGIQLLQNGRVYYGYFDDEEDYIFRFSLLSEVGEVWVEEIKRIIKTFKVEISLLDEGDEYRDIWSSFTYKNGEKICREK